MNDADIIKAFECCAQGYYCIECPLIGTHNCITQMSENAINLIRRQKAEIEEQDQAIINALHYMKEIRVEAIKEFAERLKQSAFDCDVSFGYGREHYTEAVAVVEIDNLVKEMTGE